MSPAYTRENNTPRRAAEARSVCTKALTLAEAGRIHLGLDRRCRKELGRLRIAPLNQSRNAQLVFSNRDILRSSLDGVILGADVDPFSSVRGSVLMLGEGEGLSAALNIPAERLAEMKVGTRVTVSAPRSIFKVGQISGVVVWVETFPHREPAIPTRNGDIGFNLLVNIQADNVPAFRRTVLLGGGMAIFTLSLRRPLMEYLFE